MKAWWLLCLVVVLVGCGKYTVGGKTADEIALELQSEKSSERAAAMKKLGRIAEQDASAVPLLAQALDDRDTSNRLLAITLLKNLGPQGASAVPALQKMTDDKKVGFDAANAIRVIEGKEPLPFPMPKQ